MTRREPMRMRDEGRTYDRCGPPASRPARPRSDYYRDSERRRRPRPRYEEEWDDVYEEDYPRRAPTGRSGDYGRAQRRGPRYDSYYEDAYEEYPEVRSPRQRRVQTSRQQLNPSDMKKKKTKGNLVFSLVYNLIFYVLTIGILMMSVMFAFSSSSNSSIMGYRFYTVLTNSMVPKADSDQNGFYAGDIVIVQMMDGEKAQEGDIVTFSVGEGDRYLTHRVVKTMDELNGEEGSYLITKGDANDSNDPPIEADKVLGKVVFSIPQLGSVLEFVRENFWLTLLCVLSTFGFILVLKAYLFHDHEPPQQQVPVTVRPLRGR